VLTDLEFYEIRYSGKAAALVRAFRAVYLGLFFNIVIMSTVNLAAAKIANVLLGWPMWQTLGVCAIINVSFASIAGLWGVLITDVFQFVIAMTASFAAAYYALAQPQVGGLTGLMTQIPPSTLQLLPDFNDWPLTLSILILPLTISWWSVWYPGSEPGGGSYIAQRILAARSERDALGGTLFFNWAHYSLRPWPWIIVALSSILVYPTLDDIARAFPYLDRRMIGHDTAYSAMLTFLPHGILGLMVSGLLAAYVSTISTHLNWGTSYLVHDLYRRFIRSDADERHYVMMGRIVTGLLMLCAAGMTFLLESARASFDLLLSIGAGSGLLYLLRWYWWRINAWSEIAAMVVSFVVSIGFFAAGKAGMAINPNTALLATVFATTFAWLAVTFATRPEKDETLINFYRLIRPAGSLWGPIPAKAGVGASPVSISMQLLGWVLGCTFVYSTLFGAGSILYGYTTQAAIFVLVWIISGAGLLTILRRIWSA
jgi:Na+/proline symporter